MSKIYTSEEKSVSTCIESGKKICGSLDIILTNEKMRCRSLYICAHSTYIESVSTYVESGKKICGSLDISLTNQKKRCRSLHISAHSTYLERVSEYIESGKKTCGSLDISLTNYIHRECLYICGEWEEDMRISRYIPHE